MDKPLLPKRKYSRFKRNHILGEWEFDGIEKFDYDFNPPHSKEYKYVEIEEIAKSMDRKKMMEDILALVDTNPMNEIDINPIILEYTEGLEFNQKVETRKLILSVLRELKEDNEITYLDDALGKILGASAMVFFNDSVLVRSTKKRNIENKEPNIPAKKMTLMTMLRSLWDVTSKNPLISGIIALIVGSIILKLFHII